MPLHFIPRVGESTTVVGASRQLLFNDTMSVGATRQLAFEDLIKVGAQVGLLWNERQVASQQKQLLWNVASATPVWRAEVDNTSTGNIYVRGTATEVNVSSSITAKQLAFRVSRAGTPQSADGSGIPKVIEIMDTSFNVLATSGSFTSTLWSADAALGPQISLTSPYAMSAGTKYIIGVRYTGTLANATGLFPGWCVTGGPTYLGGFSDPAVSPKMWYLGFTTADPGPWATATKSINTTSYNGQGLAVYG